MQFISKDKETGLRWPETATLIFYQLKDFLAWYQDHIQQQHLCLVVDQVTAVEAVGTMLLLLLAPLLLALMLIPTRLQARMELLRLKLRNSIRIRKCWLLADC